VAVVGAGYRTRRAVEVRPQPVQTYVPLAVFRTGSLQSVQFSGRLPVVWFVLDIVGE